MRKITYDAVLHRKRQLDIDQSDVLITGGSISGVTINEHMDSATDPALNAAVSTAIVDEYNGILITLTGAGNNQTLQDPTTVANVKAFTVANNDTSTNNVVAIAGGVSFTITAGEAQSFIWDGSAWGPMDMGITDIPVKVIQGGTGLSTLTNHGILLGSTTDAVTPMTELATGEVVIGATGADATALAANITVIPKKLKSTGTSTVGQDPAWDVDISGGTLDNLVSIDTNGNVKDAGSASSILHARSHDIVSTSDHTSTATPAQMLKADANGLPVDASNTDTQVASAVTHIGESGASHSFIDQSVVIGSAPSFLGTNITTEVVNDTTPQLGGDLDGQGNYSLNNQSITNLASNSAGYHFNGTSDYQTLSNIINTGANFAISAWVKSNDLSAYNTIFSDASGSAYDAFRFTSTHLDLRVNGVTSKYAYSFANDKLYHICVTKNDSNSYFYINGNYIGMQDILGSADGVSLSIIGKRSMDDLYMKGFIGGLRIENYTMSATEVKDLYSNANIPFKYEGASQTALTTGSLVVGKEYIIDTFAAGDDFVNVGGTNVTGTIFTATGTTPTTWANASSLRTQGNVLNCNSSGVGHTQWLDASGNENHGTNSGALPTNLEVNHIEKVIKNTITGDTLWTGIVPAGYVIDKIIFEETAGNAGVLSMGTSDAANDVFTGVTIAASTFTVLDNADLSKSMFSSTAAQTLDLNDDTGGDDWNAASVNVTFLMKRII